MSRALATALLVLLVPAAFAAERTLIDFEIEDQFESKHMQADLLGAPCYLLGSDREGSPYNRLWGPALKDSLAARGLGDRVETLGLADLRGVPFFLKGFVRGKFPKEEAGPILMDWKGHFPKAYDFMPGECNILVFDAAGELVLRLHGREPEAAAIGRVLEAIETALAP